MLSNLSLTEHQRKTALFILQRCPRFDTKTIFEEMNSAGLQVSLATLYRTLAKLVDAGLVRRLDCPTESYEHDLGA